MIRRSWVLYFLLIFCFIFCSSAYAVQYTAGGIYTITYDDAFYTLDDTSYISENTETYHWLYLLYNDRTVIDASYEMIEAYEDLTLYSADSQKLELYKKDMLDSFSDQNAVYTDVRKVGSNQIPFYIFCMEDENGKYYLAETVVKGCAIDFMSYPVGDGDATEENYSDLIDIIDTFEPATQK